MRLLILITFVVCQQALAQTKEYEIKSAKMTIEMPNEAWALADKKVGDFTSYIFKRNPIADSLGRQIIPAIMIFVEDATSYEQDVTRYTIAKRLQFQGKGINVDKILIHENENYPISYKNSFLTLCSYSDNGLEHLLYMIHIINGENKGIQIYMDMTKELEDKYISEFWTAMRSISETK